MGSLSFRTSGKLFWTSVYFAKGSLCISSRQFLLPLPVNKIKGIGKVTTATLQALGVTTITDLHRERLMLHELFSETAFSWFMRVGLGLGSVTHSANEPQKSVSTERTFSPTDDPSQLALKCTALCRSVCSSAVCLLVRGKCQGAVQRLGARELGRALRYHQDKDECV